MKKSPLVNYILWSTVAFLVIILFFRHDNLIRWIKAGLTIRKQEKQIEWYDAEIKELDKQIEAMSTDRDTLEKYARERFLFAEPGDDVYLIPDDNDR
jgi:cell division protein FtsB